MTMSTTRLHDAMFALRLFARQANVTAMPSVNLTFVTRDDEARFRALFQSKARVGDFQSLDAHTRMLNGEPDVVGVSVITSNQQDLEI